MSSSFPTSTCSGIGLTLVIALILLASNFTVIDAQQQGQPANQPEELENGITNPAATVFQSANDSFRIPVPAGWIAHDINNSTSAMTEETRLGYGLIAQLCLQEEQQQGVGGVSANTGGSTNNDNTSSDNRCQGLQEEVIHIIRYPDLDTRLLANNVTTINNNNNTTTTDNIISYQLQKLQEVGYRSMRIVTTTDMTVNLTNPFTNQTVTTLPAKIVEITYGTNFAPNEIRRGYFVTTATNATAPNPGDIKGYSVFYEGNSTATNATTTTTAIVTPASTSLPAPTQVAEIFDSFELLLAPELVQVLPLQTAQSAETAEDTTDDEEDSEAEDDDDDGDDNGGDDDDGDDNGGDDDDGDDNGGDDDGGDLDDCIVVGGTGPSDDCDMTPDDNGGGDIDGGDDDGGDEGEGNEGEDNPNEFDDCIVTPGRDPGDDGC
jgi:hypothetical protein